MSIIYKAKKRVGNTVPQSNQSKEQKKLNKLGRSQLALQH